MTFTGGAAAAAFVLGMLAATAVNMKAPVRSTSLSLLPVASDLPPEEIAEKAQPHELTEWGEDFGEIYSKIIAADGVQLDMPDKVFRYNPQNDWFEWKKPPFGGGFAFAHYSNAAPYWYDKWTLADKGLYKLWRDGAGGYYTVEIEYSQAPRGFTAQLIFTCRANDSWDDLSDEC